jgi:hypothetical protein
MPIIRRNAGGLMIIGATAELEAVEGRTRAKSTFEELRDLQLPQRTRDAIRTALDELEGQAYWQNIQSETSKRLTDIIDQAIRDKLSNYALGMLIREELGGMTANRRAQRIARTETTGAMNAGHVAAMEDLAMAGIITGKQWLAMGDQDVRLDHAAVSGVAVGPRADFNVGGWAAPYPGYWGLPAEQRIHCRCTVLSVLNPNSD